MQMMQRIASESINNQPPQSYQIPNSSQEFKRLQLQLSLGDPTVILKNAFSMANPKMIQYFRQYYPMYEPIRLFATVPSAQPKDWALLSFSPMPTTAVFQIEVLAVPGQMLVSQERDLSRLPSHFDSLVVTNMKSGAQEFLLYSSQYLCVNFIITAQIQPTYYQKCQMCLLCKQQGVSRQAYFKTEISLPDEVETAGIFCYNDNLYLCYNCDKLIHHYALVQHKRLPINEATRIMPCRVHYRMSMTVYDISANQFYCETCCAEQGIRVDGVNVVRVHNFAGELELRENRKLELYESLQKFEAYIASLQQFNERLVKYYSDIELELLAYFKRMFLDLQREKTLAIQYNVGNVLLLYNMHEQHTRSLALLLKPSTTTQNTYIQNTLAIQDLQSINFVEMRLKIYAFQSCLKQRADALQTSFIQPVRENEAQLSYNFQRLADLRNYGVQYTQPSDKLYKVSTREVYTEEKYDTALSYLQSELTYGDIIYLLQKETRAQNVARPEYAIEKYDASEQQPTGIQLLQKMLQEKTDTEQSYLGFSTVKSNKYEYLFKEIQTGPYSEKTFRKLPLNDQRQAYYPFDAAYSGTNLENEKNGGILPLRQADKQDAVSVAQPQIDQPAQHKLLYGLYNGRSYAVLKKLCSGPVVIDMKLKGAALVSRRVRMNNFQDEVGYDESGTRIQAVFNKKFIILGDVCIFSDFAGAEIGQQYYEVVYFDVFAY